MPRLPRIYLPEKIALSKHQSLRAAWAYRAGYTPRSCHGSITGGTFTPARGTQLGEHEGGRGMTSWNQKGREVRSTSPSSPRVPSTSWTYPGVAGTALSSHGLSEGNSLSWTGPPAPAELATKPKNKVMSPFQKAYLLGESSHCRQFLAGKRFLQEAPLSCHQT